MNALKTASVLVLTLGLSSAFAADKAELKADKSAANAACAEDAKVAQCKEGESTLGKGLMKCFHAYKKEHKDFKPSQACKESLEKVRHARKEIKSEKEESKTETK